MPNKTQKKSMKTYQLELSYANPKFWYNRTLPVNSKEWRELRQVILQRDNYTCSFCQIRLSKYMVVDHINGDGSDNSLANLRLNCKACDRIRHCGLAELNGEIRLGLSKLSQVEIVKRSHIFYLKHKKNPTIKEIDPNAYLINGINLSCFEVAEKRELNNSEINQLLVNCKGFFTQNMDFSYLRWIIKE